MQHEDHEQYDAFVIPQAPADAQPDTEDGEGDGAIKAVEQDGKRQLVGYAVVWGAISSPRKDGFRHRFNRGSIKWSTPTLALWHHDTGTPLASTDNGTLTVQEDDYGVRVTIDLDDTTAGDDAWKRVNSRLVRGMSFGGVRLAYDRTDNPRIIDVTSFIGGEVTLTPLPAMTETNVVTADQADQLQKIPAGQKENSMAMQKSQLDKLKLALLQPTGKVSA